MGNGETSVQGGPGPYESHHLFTYGVLVPSLRRTATTGFFKLIEAVHMKGHDTDVADVRRYVS